MTQLTLRIVAGSLKGKRLTSPTWEGLRPTAERLRETLFNVLGPNLRGARVLDGYAGTGALGIEAISRGAAHVTFVESDRRAQALIAKNVARCAITEGYAIIRSSVARALEAWQADPAFDPFDLILLDPPYDQPPDAVLASAQAAVAPGGLVVLEHARRQATPESLELLIRIRQITSGDSALSLYAPRR